MSEGSRQLHVSIVAIPDAVISTLTGIYDVLNGFKMLAKYDAVFPKEPPFHVEIVSETGAPVMLASGLPINVSRSIADLQSSDIVIVPSILLDNNDVWEKGRYPELVKWLRAMHERGAVLCSACSGLFLLAESGLFDGAETTVHWAYAEPFRIAYPAVPIFPERVLVIAGERQQLVTSGASMTWHDLALYLVARYAGATAAQAMARSFALQWHHDGLAPYIVFDGPKNHGDAEIVAAQNWLATNFSVGSPVDEMIRQSGLAERTFKRRFTEATGFSPIDYVQRLRVEDAKRRLERTEAPVDEISWKVGYEDPAFFRRLFKRTTGLSPGLYRRRFQIPEFASGSAARSK
jgi:transcriptional regulator GlxA family with amidase domain